MTESLASYNDLTFGGGSPTPEFLTHVTTHYESHTKLLTAYYWMVWVFSVFVIILCVGEFVTYNECANESNVTNGFFWFAIVIIVFAVIIFGMSIYALAAGVGFGVQKKMAEEYLHKKFVGKRARDTIENIQMNEYQYNLEHAETGLQRDLGYGQPIKSELEYGQHSLY